MPNRGDFFTKSTLLLSEGQAGTIDLQGDLVTSHQKAICHIIREMLADCGTGEN